MNEEIQGFPEGSFRTGPILESSDWLQEGKAFSSNAWEKTVGGQPNQNYDPNAVQPAGYYQEGGTFIHGPRDILGEALQHAKNDKEREIILKELSGKSGVPPEGTGIGPEKERGLKERLEKMRTEALKSVARTGAAADRDVATTAYPPERFEEATTPTEEELIKTSTDSMGNIGYTKKSELLKKSKVGGVSKVVQQEYAAAKAGGAKAEAAYLRGLDLATYRALTGRTSR